MKVKRLILHRKRGWTVLNERKYFKSFRAWDDFVTGKLLRGWEVRLLTEAGINL